MKDAYKRYWYTKTSLLEEAIIEEEKPVRVYKHLPVPETRAEENDDCVTTSIVAPKLESVTNSHQYSDKTSTSVLDSDIVACEFANKDTVWGDHLKKTVVSTRDTAAKKSTSCQFTEKLFKGLKLKKRNPRKSMNCLEKFKSLANPSSAGENSQNVPETNSNSVERIELFATEDTIFDSPSCVKITGGKSLNIAQPINVLCGVLDSPQTRPRVLKNKIDEGWLERCEKVCELENSTEASESKTCCDTRDSVPSSDEDYVYSSEDEQSVQNSAKLAPRTCLLNQEIKSDNVIEAELSPVVPANKEDNISTVKQIDPINAAKNLIDICSNNGCGSVKRSSSDSAFSVEKKMKIANYDSQRKMTLLEKKLVSGKANENFVSIDLRRKIFVRGKKGMNYAKYKKENWKMKKKVASMQSNDNASGPSILKCFKCGDVGHFSKQCKKSNFSPVDEVTIITLRIS